ncbi:Phage_base_V domain-containing protein [Rhodovastum atsumiense]|uniref:Gp5/Type VI secretion system Vgr protein OB-fold domain-containing protein n=1 Tax=Rhodovastum atsumiense TaxID=504468 RepID=A0A5M6IYQ4_9PROT|nr:phage baseplate assembly protein V [Rhodovastum atsumiense]KAA5613480.1 hypothetical protein F1189_05335 [Rhodovastum atsumiense]CAH2603222.1 Phage_base_V domain-containing protein [Rhodovastum atsumiense]
MDDLLNLIRREAERAVRGLAQPRAAVVTSYDPDRHAVKVLFGEDGTESQWLALSPAWAGNGWGLYCGPVPGTQVAVSFLGGAVGTGMVTGHLPNLQDRPPAVPAGEAWLVHQSGARIRLLNGGTAEINARVVQVTGAEAVRVDGPAGVTITAPTTHVIGDLLVSGEIADHDGAHHTFGYLRDAYNAHGHPVPWVEPGPATVTSDITNRTVP